MQNACLTHKESLVQKFPQAVAVFFRDALPFPIAVFNFTKSEKYLGSCLEVFPISVWWMEALFVKSNWPLPQDGLWKDFFFLSLKSLASSREQYE